MTTNKLTLLIALFASANVFAQADNFSGFNVGLNTGFAASKSVYTDTSDSTTTSLGGTNTPFDFDLGYAFAMSDKSTFGIGATYDLSTITTAKYSENTHSGKLTKDTKLKNHYSIYLAPGYAMSDSTLGYAKLAYHAGKETLEDYSKSARGTGYGFGIKQALDKNLYLNLSVESVTYNSVSFSTAGYNNKLKQTISNIGIGYKF